MTARPLRRLFALAAGGFLASLTAAPLAAQDLTAPTDLTAQASAPGDLAISLFWTDNSLDEDGFEIQRRIVDSGADFATIDLVPFANVGSYNDIGLPENTAYEYRVRAVAGAVVGDFSNVDAAQTSYARPDQVTDLQGALIGSSVLLTWTDNADNETRYEVERVELGGTAFETIAVLDPDSITYEDPTPRAGTTYLYRVVPWRFDVDGGRVDVVTIETGAGAVAPRSVVIRNRARTSLEIGWSYARRPSDRWRVQIQLFDWNTGFWTDVASVPARRERYTVSRLTRGTSYLFRVRTVTPTAYSPWVEVSGTTR